MHYSVLLSSLILSFFLCSFTKVFVFLVSFRTTYLSQWACPSFQSRWEVVWGNGCFLDFNLLGWFSLMGGWRRPLVCLEGGWGMDISILRKLTLMLLNVLEIEVIVSTLPSSVWLDSLSSFTLDYLFCSLFLLLHFVWENFPTL